MAAATRNKVVRIENLGPSVHFCDDGISDSDSQSALRPDSEQNFNGDEDLEDVELEISSSIGDEANDVLPPLPSGWPHIPQLFVRQSWDFTTSVCPSINKATNHLELLQNSLESWAQQEESRIASQMATSQQQSRASSAGPVPPLNLARGTTPLGVGKDGPPTTSTPTGRRQLRFVPSSIGSHIPATIEEKSYHGESPALSHPASHAKTNTPQLSVQGLGAHMPPEPDRASAQKELDLTMPYLGAEEVIEEVITLIAKLEKDRREIKDLLKNENARVDKLGNQIDRVAQQRMEELPQCVQREHEACAMDINELNWHVSYRSRGETRIKNKVAIAEVLNSRLKEDIGFVKKHCPLVEEKLELEMEAMSRIKMAQSDTNDELRTTVERCAKVEDKSEEANQKATAERKHIKSELDNVRKDLQQISEELAEAKMTFSSYISDLNQYHQELKDNQQELRILEVRCENTKAAEEMQATKVEELKSKIVEQEYEHRRLEDDNIAKQNALQNSREENAVTLKSMSDEIQAKEEELKRLRRSNLELEMNIGDNEEKIKECDEKKKRDEKNLTRMSKEMDRTDEQSKTTEEELAKIMVINNAIRKKFADQERRCIQTEDQLKTTAETLRHQVKEEVHSRISIQSQIGKDKGDLQRNDTEVIDKKTKVYKKEEEVAAAVAAILAKVQKLRAKHAEKTKIANGLQEELDGVRKEQSDFEKDIADKKQEISPKEKILKDSVLALNKRIDHIDWKSELMREKIKDMNAQSKMMNKSMAKTQKAVDELQDESDDLTVKTNTQLHVMQEMRINLAGINDRMENMGKHHKQHQKDRANVLEKTIKDYENNLAENKVLASRYRQLQNEFLAVKNDLLNKYDARIKIENAIKDLKQVKGLQLHMHASLQEYYKYRRWYNQSELDRMEGESAENAAKVGELQESMDEALDTITGFLGTQMDGTNAHKIAMTKVLQEEKHLAAVKAATPPAPKTPADPNRLPLGIKVTMPLTMEPLKSAAIKAAPAAAIKAL